MDTHFLVIQEEWIYKNDKPQSLDQVIPGELADLIRDLGCNRFTCRNNAENILRMKRSEITMKAIAWGSHHRDQEIANRCDLLMRDYLICDHCRGTTICPNQFAYWDRPCKVCSPIYRILDYDESLYHMLTHNGCIKCFGSGQCDRKWLK